MLPVSSREKKERAVAPVIETARNVLKIEAEAISTLTERLDERFEKALDLLAGCTGRVILTGMGKPGIIGRKISATLASTGTPSLFLHPAEAIHGDLGMVVREDVVIVLSKSGETDEITRLLPLIKKIGAKIIALTGGMDSTLAKHSDVALDVSVSKEACTLGVAPTTSTTATLALGDALAICLLEMKGFDIESYAFYHPGGSLGRQLLKVESVMRSGKTNPVVTGDTAIKEVLIAITRARAGAASVIDTTGKLVGIFTDGDLRRAVEKISDISSHKVSEFMSVHPITITKDKLVAEAFRVMRGDNEKQRKLDELPVVDETGCPVGMLDVIDLLGLA